MRKKNERIGGTRELGVFTLVVHMLLPDWLELAMLAYDDKRRIDAIEHIRQTGQHI
jgi:hypothetical protein